MYSIDLTGKNGVIIGVANDRSIAWGIASILAQAGARLALTYQNDRVKDRVTNLADTLDGAMTMPCDATDDSQVEEVFHQVGENFGEISFLVHSIAFANREDLSGRFPIHPVKDFASPWKSALIPCCLWCGTPRH